MVIQLRSLSDHLVRDIVRKVDPLTFPNACLSSKYLNRITQKYKNCIRFLMPGYQIELFEKRIMPNRDNNGLDNLIICVRPDEKPMRCYECLPEEIMKTRPELEYFIFENIYMHNSCNDKILKGLQNELLFCYRPSIVSKLVNETIRIFRPTELVWSFDDQNEVPSEIIEMELLETMRGLHISVEQDEHVRDCIEKIAPRIPHFSLSNGWHPVQRIELILDDIKSNIQRIISGCPSFINKDFRFYADIPFSKKFVHLIRPFQEISNTLWKRFGRFSYSTKYNYVVFFFRARKDSTLGLFIEESVDQSPLGRPNEKNLYVLHGIFSNTKEFLDFFALSLNVPMEEAMKELTGRKRKRQFNRLKREYFSNK